MILTEEIAARVVRLTTTDGLAVGDSIYWNDGADSDGVGVIQSITDSTSVVIEDGAVRMIGHSLYAKATAQGFAHRTRVVSVTDAPGTYTRVPAGTEGTIDSSGDATRVVIAHPDNGTWQRTTVGGTTSPGRLAWAGLCVPVNAPVVTPVEPTAAVEWTPVHDVPRPMDSEFRLLVLGDDLGSEPEIVTISNYEPRPDATAWVLHDGRRVLGAILNPVVQPGERVMAVDTSDLDGCYGHFGTVVEPRAMSVSMKFDGPMSTTSGRGAGHTGDSASPTWYVTDYVRARRKGRVLRRQRGDDPVAEWAGLEVIVTENDCCADHVGQSGRITEAGQINGLPCWTAAEVIDSTPDVAQEQAEPAFTPTWDNPEPGVTANLPWYSRPEGADLVWSQTGVTRHGWTGVQRVTVTEETPAYAGRNGWLINVTEATPPRYWVLGSDLRTRLEALGVAAGWDAPVAKAPTEGTVWLSEPVTHNGRVYPAGTPGRAYIGAMETRTCTFYPDDDRAAITVPWASLTTEKPEALGPNWFIDPSLTGQALADRIAEIKQAANERWATLWEVLDETADEQEWCGEYESFSDRVGGDANRESRREREYEFEINVNVTVGAADLDNALASALSDFPQVDIQDEVTVTNRVVLRYTTNDPDDVDVYDVLEYHGISQSAYDSASIETYEEA